MSVHAMIAAAYLENLDPATRLVLMAIADSSDEHTLEAAPGLPKLRAWSGLSKSQALRVVAKLADPKGYGLVERMSPGARGRRAVFRVFPAGIPTIPHPSEVAARYADDEVVPNVENPQSYPQDPTGKGRTDATLTPELGSHEAPLGSHGCDPFSPLFQSSTGRPPANPPARRVDKPTTSASNASGFPGAKRATEDDAAGIARRARGANDVACPLHPGHVHPCRMCARDAAQADPARVADQLAEARKALRKNRPATATTEETKTA